MMLSRHNAMLLLAILWTVKLPCNLSPARDDLIWFSQKGTPADLKKDLFGRVTMLDELVRPMALANHFDDESLNFCDREVDVF